MPKFNIFHPANGKLNDELNLNQEWKYITTIECSDINQAFFLAQNDFHPAYRVLRKRSTSVGDIISQDNDYYFVAGIGFQKIEEKLKLPEPIHV